MELDQNGGRYGRYDHIIVVFNANTTQQSFTSTTLAGRKLRLHPVQSSSSDPVVRTASFDEITGTVVVPGLTTAVFVTGGER